MHCYFLCYSVNYSHAAHHSSTAPHIQGTLPVSSRNFTSSTVMFDVITHALFMFKNDFNCCVSSQMYLWNSVFFENSALSFLIECCVSQLLLYSSGVKKKLSAYNITELNNIGMQLHKGNSWETGPEGWTCEVNSGIKITTDKSVKDMTPIV